MILLGNHKSTGYPSDSSSSSSNSSRLASLRQRLQTAWRRYQRERIQLAIETYSVEKHFLHRGFHPVVGEATLRMVAGEIERNKLPFHADNVRPWLAASPPALGAPAELKETPETEKVTVVEGIQPVSDPASAPEAHSLPKSLRVAREAVAVKPVAPAPVEPATPFVLVSNGAT